jgi:hypothetical protein
MRITLLSLAVILLGIALGVGLSVLRIGTASWRPDLDQGSGQQAAPPSGPAPKVVVDQTDYDFGALDMAAKGSHDFLFRNAGDAPLKLVSGGTSCRCTVSELGQEEVSPGGSTKVILTWKPIDKSGPYQQTAKVLTNDPARPQVTLSISGRFTTAVQVFPPELVFSGATSGETASATARLACYLDQPLRVLGHEWSEAATARHFEAVVRPLTAEELKEFPAAQSGLLVTVTVKAGLPQGLFRQKLRFQTNLASSPTVTLPIEGIIGSEIAVVGPDWNPDSGVLTFGAIASRSGAKRRLMLVVRGPMRKQVAFKAVQISPSLLRVSLGEKREISHGDVVATPLMIEIPPGSPTVDRLGSEQGKLGEIILESTHPQVPKLRILVRFAVVK